MEWAIKIPHSDFHFYLKYNICKYIVNILILCICITKLRKIRYLAANKYFYSYKIIYDMNFVVSHLRILSLIQKTMKLNTYLQYCLVEHEISWECSCHFTRALSMFCTSALWYKCSIFNIYSIGIFYYFLKTPKYQRCHHIFVEITSNKESKKHLACLFPRLS